MRLGILAAFKEVNAAGGVHGRQLRLISKDDGYEPEQTITNIHELIEKEKSLHPCWGCGHTNLKGRVANCIEDLAALHRPVHWCFFFAHLTREHSNQRPCFLRSRNKRDGEEAAQRLKISSVSRCSTRTTPMALMVCVVCRQQ